MKKTSNSTKFKGLMIALLVSFAFSVVVCPCASAASMWSKTYGGLGNDTGTGDTIQASDGGYAISGDTNSSGAGGLDFWLFKTDAAGNMLWNKTYGGVLDEVTGGMCQTSDGGYAISGYTSSFGAGGRDFYLVRTGADGTAFWAKTYGGADNEYALTVTQTFDGGYAMVGYTSSFGAGGNDFWLVKTDANGNMQWNKTYGETGLDSGMNMVQTSDGGYAMVGYTTSFGGYKAYLVKADASGNLQWNMTYGGSGVADIGIHLIQTADGGYAVAGWNYVNGQDFILYKTDASGNLEWDMTYGCAGVENAYALLQDSDGGYVLTGNTNSFGAGGNDIWLLKTDELGTATAYSWDWPMFCHCLSHSGCSNSPAPSTNQTLWNYTTGGAVYGSTAVVDGKVYIGSQDKNMYCLDASTGALLWNYTTGAAVWSSSPAVAYARVYFGSADKNVYCLDAASGVLLWNYTTGNQIVSSFAVSNGKAYVGSTDKNVYCFDALTGTLIWNYTAGDSIYASSPAIAGGKLYVGSRDDNLYCLDAATGTLIWNYTTGNDLTSTVAVANGRVFIGSSDDNLYCLDAATGALLWNYTTGGDANNVAAADGKVYVGSSDYNLYCFDAATGAKIWNYTTENQIISPPAVADGKVYTGSMDKKVYCLNAATGALIWSYTTGGMIYGPGPAIANGVVYMCSGDSQVYAFGTQVVPEGLTLGVMLLLSTVAVIVSARYFRKRQKWENWQTEKP